MNVNTSKERSFYTQGQQFAARVLLAFWLLASGSPDSILATPKRQMVPATTTSPQGSSLASTPPTPPPGGALELASDVPDSFWGDSAGSSPSIDAAPQERMSQEAAPSRGCELLRTSPKVTSVEEHLSFQAREGESVRFSCQMGQWHAEVSSHIGSASRRAVLPVVCSRGEDVASSLEVLSKYPSWYSQRQIHVLDRNLCPTLGEVVYVGELGLKGGGEGGDLKRQRSSSNDNPPQDRKKLCSAEPKLNPAEADSPSTVDQLKKRLKTLAPNPQIDQQPEKLAELGEVLLKLAASKQEETGAAHQDLSPYTDAAILYQHVLSICAQEDAQKKKILASEKAKELVDRAYRGLAQIQASMLARAKEVAPRAITPESTKALYDRIEKDKLELKAIRTKAKKEEEVADLSKLRDKQGSPQEVHDAEVLYIAGSQKLFVDIAKAIKSLLARLYRESEDLLGSPPASTQS